MKRFISTTIALMAIVTFSTSCKQLFTTSIGAGFARTGSIISSNATVTDLLDIADSDLAADKTVATEILNALATKPDEVAALSIDDKTVILDLALDATIELSAVFEALETVMAGGTGTTDDVIAALLDSVNTSVDLTAITAILDDPTAAAEAPVDSLVTASVAVLADIAGTVGSTVIQDIMNAPDRDQALADAITANTITTDQKDDIQVVVDLMETLNTTRKAELAEMSIGEYNLGDYLIEGV